MGYVGVNAGNFPVGVVREIAGSRMNFALDHATESYRLGFFRQEVDYTFDPQKTSGIMGRNYVELYPFNMKVPDLLLTVARMKNWYMAAKEPNNLRVKLLTRNNTVSYLNFTGDADTSLVALIPEFSVDNTISKCMIEFNAGLTPDQRTTMCTLSTGAKTGGTGGGTGTAMTAMVNSRTDRNIAGIKKVTIGGAEVNLLTKENCKWNMKGVVPGDRKAYNDMQFINAFLTNATIEMMGVGQNIEVAQAVLDEISSAGTMPEIIVEMQSGLQVIYEEQTATIVPKEEGGDNKGHLTLDISYEAQFNTYEATPDSIEFDEGANTVTFKSLD
jgi:hypothetical protein